MAGTLTTAIKTVETSKLTEEEKQGVLATLHEASGAVGSALATDRTIYRLIVIFLGLAVLVALVGILALVALGKADKLPDGVVAIASAAVGALAGLLAPSPAQRAT
jgi:hypothetical protein